MQVFELDKDQCLSIIDTFCLFYCSEVSTSAPPDTSILTVSARDDDRSVQFSTVSNNNC